MGKSKNRMNIVSKSEKSGIT